MKLTKYLLGSGLLVSAFSICAAPLPNTIMVQDKAVVPVLKTEVIRRVEGQQPERTVEATVLEISNKGQDIVAKEVVFKDDLNQFTEKKLPTPILQKGKVIVPTSKIEINRTLTSEGKVIGQAKQIDVEGVEFQKGLKPAKRTLQLDQIQNPQTNKKISHAVIGKDGVVTKDVIVVE
ncbi:MULTISPECIES: hypothetical protein [unclassified Acinetobacter]|uniref:hypothetical protein n=1 Tax=unclassified Acinetobacter TaxID=196816 RepID=UPI002934B91A|nr:MULTISPECIES: hypothetical protein [unclassified Acinetobacter]WOE31099.1 hypothetical protein QSG84_12225 [Acinetobacter sp. SAAs470]WOE39295.1 hypothetical protein QSG86_05890 [Acinetobacter sp. SAAs474]